LQLYVRTSDAITDARRRVALHAAPVLRVQPTPADVHSHSDYSAAEHCFSFARGWFPARGAVAGVFPGAGQIDISALLALLARASPTARLVEPWYFDKGGLLRSPHRTRLTQRLSVAHPWLLPFSAGRIN